MRAHIIFVACCRAFHLPFLMAVNVLSDSDWCLVSSTSSLWLTLHDRWPKCLNCPLAGPKTLNNYLVGLFFLIIDMSFCAITLNNSLLRALAAKLPLSVSLSLSVSFTLCPWSPLLPALPLFHSLPYSSWPGYVTHTTLNALMRD